MMWKFLSILILVILECAIAPPVDTQKKDTDGKNDESEALDDFGLEYGRYLQQVVQALEGDKEFAKKLENISAEQIRSGHIAKELEFVKQNVRTKLDELKRIELDRLRKLIQEQMERTELGLDRKGVKIPKHLDVENPYSFEIEDLKKLIQTATNDLEELDRKRREEFKQYELEKEAAYREGLKNMTEEDKKKAQQHHEEMIQKHKDHPKVHHPGSKPQLEQVWEDQDHMPRQEFNPRTFFAMHDVNGDGHLDVEEVEAILIPEVKKLYNPDNEEDDPAEMMEEFHRMREHIFNETDKNKDSLISLEEFLKMTEQQDFQQDDGWKGLDEQQIYSERELEEYMRQRQMHQQGQYYGDQRMYYDVGNSPDHGVPPHINYQGQPGGVPMQGYPQQPPYQQGHPPQFQQGHQQQFQQGHPQQFQQPHLQQFQQGHPQQQFQQGHPQQQFQQGHPQQQFQQGHPQQQFQQGHPQQQFQQGHPQQQFQQGHPQQLQQPGQPQQFQQPGQPQIPQGQPQQFQAVLPQAPAQQLGNNIHPSNPQVADEHSQSKVAEQQAGSVNPQVKVVNQNSVPNMEQKPVAAQASVNAVPPKQQS